MSNKFTVRHLTYDAMLAAMYFALSFITIRIGSNMKISVSGLPILIAGLLFGPTHGFLVGLLGAFLEQLFSEYGLAPTTALWVLPAAIRGLVVGLYAKGRRFEMNKGQILFITLLSAIVLTVCNTLAMYIDSKLLGYYTYAYVFGMLLWRFLSGIAISIVFALILPPLLQGIRKIVKA